MNCFEEEYSCFSCSSIRKSILEEGNTIIMPALALNRLVALNRQVSINVDYPLIFEIKNHTGRVSLHSGVLEFSADDGVVFLPNWMMKNMKLESGQLVSVNLKSSSLPKSAYLKIRAKCTLLSNPDQDPKDVLIKSYPYSSSPPPPADWAGLPWELLVCILSKLNRLADYDRFGMVCGTWRSACVDLHNQQQLRVKTLENTPLLLLPCQRLPPPLDETTLSGGGAEDQWRRNLYDLFQRKLVVRDLKLPALSRSYGRCCGSSHGWLIFADIYSSITLVNPFRAEGGIIHLPPINKDYVPDDDDSSTSGDDDDNNNNLHEFDVCKVVLSADPGLSTHSYYVVAIFGEDRVLCIIKSGNKSWICFDRFQYRRFDDIIYQDGVIYAVENYRKMLCCEIKVGEDPNPNNPSETDNHFIQETFTLWIVGHLRLQSRISKYYIVKSEGELLLVYRFLVGCSRSQIAGPRTWGFKVYKLMLVRGDREWREMDSLGDRVIFLGENHSTCLSISDPRNYNLLGCRPNSIYFTDDAFTSPGDTYIPTDISTMRRTLPDMGVFNLEEQSISPFYDLPDLSKLLYVTPPIWFFPRN